MKPETLRSSKTIEVFTIRKPIEEIEVTIPGTNKKEKQWRYAHFYFTTHDSPVTVGGIQYIPLSSFDQARWDI